MTPADILQRARSQPVMVVGDIILDRFRYGTATRLSPEAPVPVVELTHETTAPGGAANVACNLAALGIPTTLVSSRANDPAHHQLAGLLPDLVTTRFVDRAGRTAVKERILAGHHPIVRVDDPATFPTTTEHSLLLDLLDLLLELLPNHPTALFCDYHGGTITRNLLSEITQANCGRANLCLDPHPRNLFQPVPGLALLKPNRAELFAMASMDPSTPHPNPLDDHPLHLAARQVWNAWKPTELLVTLGDQGLLCQSAYETKQFPPTHTACRDVTGAGDTVFATYAAAKSAGATTAQAARLANAAAHVVINKPGTTTCSKKELLNHP